jgi:hypothetical protein
MLLEQPTNVIQTQSHVFTPKAAKTS